MYFFNKRKEQVIRKEGNEKNKERKRKERKQGEFLRFISSSL